MRNGTFVCPVHSDVLVWACINIDVGREGDEYAKLFEQRLITPELQNKRQFLSLTLVQTKHTFLLLFRLA
jgi:hypothetical protein